MQFRVSSKTHIICTGCQGDTLVTPDFVYNTDDLTCNCDVFKEEVAVKPKIVHDPKSVKTLADVRNIPKELYDDIVLPTIYEPPPRKGPKPKPIPPNKEYQPKDLFDERPEHTYDEEMDESQVRAYLDKLTWQELRESAKNNEVVCQNTMKAHDIKEAIINAVFYSEVDDE